jgi:hypothetical protein
VVLDNLRNNFKNNSIEQKLKHGLKNIEMNLTISQWFWLLLSYEIRHYDWSHPDAGCALMLGSRTDAGPTQLMVPPLCRLCPGAGFVLLPAPSGYWPHHFPGPFLLLAPFSSWLHPAGSILLAQSGFWPYLVADVFLKLMPSRSCCLPEADAFPKLTPSRSWRHPEAVSLQTFLIFLFLQTCLYIFVAFNVVGLDFFGVKLIHIVFCIFDGVLNMISEHVSLTR